MTATIHAQPASETKLYHVYGEDGRYEGSTDLTPTAAQALRLNDYYADKTIMPAETTTPSETLAHALVG